MQRKKYSIKIEILPAIGFGIGIYTREIILLILCVTVTFTWFKK